MKLSIHRIILRQEPGAHVGQCRAFELCVQDRRRRDGWRSICSLWVNEFADEATWHTWNELGWGGENDTETDLVTAAEIAISRCLRQRFIRAVCSADVDDIIGIAYRAQCRIAEERKVRFPTQWDLEAAQEVHLRRIIDRLKAAERARWQAA